MSLTVGMTHIFDKLPFVDSIIAYWYNFVIMFEAVFILALIQNKIRSVHGSRYFRRNS
ncbi:MAG: hypothetical protein LBV42_01745 [Methanobrevibacter sp.]|nr:hypothetical protein [Methanobrevibacter sp.]